MNMYTLKEEIYVLIYYICFGIYLFSSLDVIDYIYKHLKKKVIKVIVIIIYWLLQIYVTYIFSYHLLDGYLPIYFLFFIFLGYYIYSHILKKRLIKTIIFIGIIFKKLLKILKKIIRPFLYSKPFISNVKKFIKHYINIMKNTFKKKDKNLLQNIDTIPNEKDIK